MKIARRCSLQKIQKISHNEAWGEFWRIMLILEELLIITCLKFYLAILEHYIKYFSM